MIPALYNHSPGQREKKRSFCSLRGSALHLLAVFLVPVFLAACSKKEALVDLSTKVHVISYSLQKLKDDDLRVYVNDNLIDTILTGQMRVDRVQLYYLTTGTDSAVLRIRKKGSSTNLITQKLPADVYGYTYPATLYHYGEEIKPILELTRPGTGKAGYRFRNQVTGYMDTTLDMKIYMVINGTYTEVKRTEAIKVNEYSDFTELEAPPAGGSYTFRLYKHGTSDLVAGTTPYSPFLAFRAGESSLIDLKYSGSNITMQLYLKQ